MANATKKLNMTRGATEVFRGVITPGEGGTLSTPILGLTFSATGAGGSVTKTLGSGVVANPQTSSSIAFAVSLDPADTSSLPNRTQELSYVLTLTEANGTVSFPVGGKLIVSASV